MNITVHKLNRLIQEQWKYAKNMLKVGFASWVSGLWSFLAITVMTNANLHGEAMPIWSSLLVVSLAAPVVVATALSSRFTFTIKRLKTTQRTLMNKYRSVLLRYVTKTTFMGVQSND